MSSLVLNSLEIENFRAFRRLRVEKLGRINLITGKNNVGKTSLLEALWLYTQNGSPTLLRELLDTRDELRIGSEEIQPRVRLAESPRQALNIKYLFHGRKGVYENVEPIRIGQIDSESSTLSITLGWFQVIEQVGDDEQAARRLVPVAPEERAAIEDAVPYLILLLGKQAPIRVPIERIFSRLSSYTPLSRQIPNRFVKANGLDAIQIGQLWDNIALTPLEQDVLASLQIIAPEAERVSVVGEQDSTRGRVPIIKLSDVDEPFPLRSLGEGMNRLFGITLALVNAKDGILLIDEVESGLHYSVQPTVWRLLFQVARRLNVQIFATTHSWDCIEAFQQAAQEDLKDEGVLIRLQKKDNELFATPYDERRLGIATREQIEVR